MSDRLFMILGEYRDAVAKIFGENDMRMVLYGSYARGDFHSDSDVDIMILADIEPKQVNDFADRVYDITYDFEEKYDMEINPCVQSQKTYMQWKAVYPFYMNIEKDGVMV